MLLLSSQLKSETGTALFLSTGQKYLHLICYRQKPTLGMTKIRWKLQKEYVWINQFMQYYKLTEQYIKLILSCYLSESKHLDSRLPFLLISSMMKWFTCASQLTCSLSLWDPLASFSPRRVYYFVSSPVKQRGIYGRVNGLHIITLSTINVYSILQFLLAIITLKTLFSRGVKLTPVWKSRARSESHLCSYLMPPTFSVSLTYQANILFYLKDKKGMSNSY